MGEYSIKTEVGELECSLAVAAEWQKSEEYIDRLRNMMNHSLGGKNFVVYGSAASIRELGQRLHAQVERAERAEAQRDALLVAAKAVFTTHEKYANGWLSKNYSEFEEACESLQSAIAEIEQEKGA